MKQDLQNQQPARNQKPFHALAAETSLDRHRRKCAVCHHPDLEAIEEAFIHWRSPDYIAGDFNLDDRRILYRHAHATGLYDRRRRNYLFTIENILERGEEFELTAAAYIKAVRAYACLCDTVRWNEPVTRVLHEYNVHTDSNGQDAPQDNPARTASPPRAETTPPDDELCGSGLQPRHNACPDAVSSRERLEGRGSSSTPPLAAPRGGSPAKRDSAERSSSSLPQAASHPSAPSSAGPCEQFLAAAIPILGASPKAAAQLRRAGLSSLAALASRHPRAPGKVEQRTPPSSSCSEPSSSGAALALQTSDLKPLTSSTSNRHTPELETRVSHRKQRSEVVSNRHKITK